MKLKIDEIEKSGLWTNTVVTSCPPPKDVLKITDVMKLLDVTRPTLDKLIKEYGLPCKIVGNKRFFLREAILDWIRDK